MSTSANTYVFSDHNKKKNLSDAIVCMNAHWDGYPTFHGLRLAKFLDGYKIVRGLGLDEDIEKIANGMGCLAAQMVDYFKTKPGNIYLYPPSNKSKETYNYYIYPKTVEVFNYDTKLFDGSWKGFLKFCRSPTPKKKVKKTRST
jgi:hypothetical protein